MTHRYESELEWASSKLEPAKLGRHYLLLSKSRLTLLVCLTAGAGAGMAPGPVPISAALLATLGTAMASAAANSTWRHFVLRVSEHLLERMEINKVQKITSNQIGHFPSYSSFWLSVSLHVFV